MNVFFQTVNNTLTTPLKRAFLTILLLGIVESKGWTQIYDAARDFSIEHNPNGVWSYGYKQTLGVPLSDLILSPTAEVL